jgi:hypothetical protein
MGILSTIATPFPSLNAAMRGGWTACDLIVVASRDEITRPIFLMQCMLRAQQEKQPIAFFTNGRLTTDVLTTYVSYVRTTEVPRGEFAYLMEAAPITVKHAEPQTNVSDVCHFIRQQYRQGNCHLAIIEGVNLLHYNTPPQPTKPTWEDYWETGEPFQRDPPTESSPVISELSTKNTHQFPAYPDHCHPANITAGTHPTRDGSSPIE